MTGELLQTVVDIGRRISGNGARELSDAVEKGSTAVGLDVRADSLPTTPQQKAARRLAASWQLDGTASATDVSSALLAAQASAEAERSEEAIDLVWTGPKTSQVPVAMNAEALNELVDSANEHLLIVSYATYQMPLLIEKLQSAVERGVGIDLVLEFHGSDADQPGTWDPVAGLGPGLPEGVRVFEWPVELREETPWGKVGYLHVKCAVADSRLAFVSSANLTVYAMTMNMELGVLIRGGEVPHRIAAHFMALIDEGVLVRRAI